MTETRHARSASTSKIPSRPRVSSLTERYPGDMSHRPLDMLTEHARRADRSRNRSHRKTTSEGGPRRHPHADMIDALDTIGGGYHHGGPYDATLASRNMDKKRSPLAAVERSNAEALRATPREYIQDSLRHHRPLQGVASVPSGERDMFGRLMEYEEGADLMREADAPGGAYKRWEHIRYHPDDLKGKGEPSYTYERDLKERKKAARGVELQEMEVPRSRRASGGDYAPVSSGLSSGRDQRVQRSKSAKVFGGLRERVAGRK